MTKLTEGQRTVLLAIKDDSTPPYKGAPLATIKAKLIDLGCLKPDGTTLTTEGYAALGVRSPRQAPKAEPTPPAAKVAKKASIKTPTKKGVEWPAGAVIVKSGTDKELGCYVPYTEDVGQERPFTFYRVYYLFGDRLLRKITDNGTDTTTARKRIVAEYNKANGANEFRGTIAADHASQPAAG